MSLLRRITRSLAHEIDAERRDRQMADTMFEERQHKYEAALAKCQDDIQVLRNELAKLAVAPAAPKKVVTCSHCHKSGHNRVTCAIRREQLGLAIL